MDWMTRLKYLIENVPDALPFVEFLPGGHSLEGNDFVGRKLNLLLVVQVCRHGEAMLSTSWKLRIDKILVAYRLDSSFCFNYTLKRHYSADF